MHPVYHLLDLFSSILISVPAVYLLSRTYGRKPTGKRLILLLFLTVYLSEVYLIVGLPGIPYFRWSPNLSLLPFRDFGDARFFIQIGLNALMFVPLGFLLPLLWPRYRQLSRLAAVGALNSAMIELLQLFSFRATDIDDFLMNTLGAVIGFFLVCRWIVPQAAAPGKDGAEFWYTNLLIVLTTIFIRPFAADLIYSLPFLT